MTPEQISALSDGELNSALIYEFNYIEDIETNGDIDYLTDWNILMPLAVKHSVDVLQCFDGNTSACAISHYTHEEEPLYSFTATNKNPARAICEVLLQIAMESKK